MGIPRHVAGVRAVSSKHTSEGWKEPVFLVDLPSTNNPELMRRLLAENESRAGLEALRALGEAIAWVARARLICRVMDQHPASATNRNRSAQLSLTLNRADELNESELLLILYRVGHEPELVQTWVGHPVDTAALGVARLIEKAEEL